MYINFWLFLLVSFAFVYYHFYVHVSCVDIILYWNHTKYHIARRLRRRFDDSSFVSVFPRAFRYWNGYHMCDRYVLEFRKYFFYNIILKRFLQHQIFKVPSNFIPHKVSLKCCLRYFEHVCTIIGGTWPIICNSFAT